MLTTVILEGALGNAFGRKWQLSISSAVHALKLIEANGKGVFQWIRSNLSKYSRYKIICTYEDGRREYVSEEDLLMNRKPKVIRFVPLLNGAGGGFIKAVLGATLFVAGIFVPGPVGAAMMSMGAQMFIGGVIQMLSPTPKNSNSQNKDGTSYYFDGPVNTTAQGVPVPLIFGRCLVGSLVVSSDITVDQVATE